MSSRRLQARVPSARAIGIGKLMAHELHWHMQGGDGSGKCNIQASSNDRSCVWGVLYCFDAAEQRHLDLAEGLGTEYTSRQVSILTPDGMVHAMTYQALLIAPGLVPYHWYREFVVRGAHEHGLPADYRRRLEAIQALVDADAQRSAFNAAILATPHNS